MMEPDEIENQVLEIDGMQYSMPGSTPNDKSARIRHVGLILF
jgi:hypothetical protein